MVGCLLALSARTGRLIDFKTALEFPLCSVDLNLANPDHSRRCTQKSRLTEILVKNSTLLDTTELPSKSEVVAYLVDLMALVRTQTQIPSTYEELTFQLLRSLPSGYQRIHIVADTYRNNSIKDPERLKRGYADKVIIRSAKSKIPRNFKNFLQNGENKSSLSFPLFWKERKEDALSLLKCKEMYFSTDGACHKTTEHETVLINELSSNQEEANCAYIHNMH